MDSTHNQPLHRSRPPYPRASSRSSTSTANTTNTKMTSATTQSASSSTSQITSSPQLSHSHPAHRYHHSACSKPSGSPRLTPGHSPQLSREASVESTRQQALSPFLQEKLQKERKAESEKVAQAHASSRLNQSMSTSVDLGRSAQTSPFKAADSDGVRPRSSTGSGSGAEPSKRQPQGMGLKDMEQVISSIHKQNFDLKLELYHRREKQANLEARIELLEHENKQVQDKNDDLADELEKREKAIEEAVAMIIMLEAKVDQLVGERNMQDDQEGFFCPQDLDAKYMRPAPELARPGSVSLEDDAKVINRMPSFLSERSENTENLRNVYLGVRGSLLSLPRVSEGYLEGDNGPSNGLASPTLSVLSESSFPSVYGTSGDDVGFPPPIDQPLSLDSVDANQRTPLQEDFQSAARERADGMPPRAATANSFSRGGHASGPFQTITRVVDHVVPPQPEQHDRPPMTLQEGFRPSNQQRPRRGSQPPQSTTSSDRRLTREEKREALRRVMTDGQGGVRLHEQNFPPTPDTISTSTLHRMRTSNDSLSLAQQKEARRSRTSVTYQHQDTDDAGVSLKEKPAPGQDRVRDAGGHEIYGHHGDIARRPRSASESTVSHKRDNDWDTDTDDESDSRSLQSSIDIWMRESTKPDKPDTCGGPVSLDHFRLPLSGPKGGWAADAMFRPNSGRSGTQGIGPDADYMNDLFSVRQATPGGKPGPLPPDRRSSLHARTVSTSDSIRLIQNSPKREPRHMSPDQRTRHARRQSDGTYMRSGIRTPVQQHPMPPPMPNSEHRRSHYPPIVGQQGPRNGLNRLFRRSITLTPSGGTPEPAPPRETDATFMGAPLSRNILDEFDRSGATPPPITRNPRQMRRNTAGAEAKPNFPVPTSVNPSEQTLDVSSVGPQTPNGQASSTGSSTGTRRKWLPGFGRAASSLKNRVG